MCLGNGAHLQDGGEEGPRSIQLIIPDEEAFVAMDHIQNQPLVGIWQVYIVTLLVREIQLCDIQVKTQSWHLVDDLKIDGLIWLNTHDLPQKYQPSVPIEAPQDQDAYAEQVFYLSMADTQQDKYLFQEQRTSSFDDLSGSCPNLSW